MTISLRDYITISDAFKEAQLDEGAVWDAIKKKLGGKASPEETEAELQRLKAIAPAEFAKIKAAEKAKDSTVQTKAAAKASAEFHARKALQKSKAATGSIGSKPTSGTSPTKAKFDAMDSKDYRAGHSRAAERAFAMGESKIDNAEAAGWYAYDSKGNICQGPKSKKIDIDAKYRDQDGGAYSVVKIDQDDIDRRERLSEAKDFEVRYNIKDGDKVIGKKVTIKGRDVSDVRKKFAETHYGAKLMRVLPARPKVEATLASGPLGPRS